MPPFGLITSTLRSLEYRKNTKGWTCDHKSQDEECSQLLCQLRPGGRYEREISSCVVFQGPEIKSQPRD